MQNFGTLQQLSLGDLADDGKREERKQAGAELCQAQVQLGLAMLAVIRYKLRATYYKL